MILQKSKPEFQPYTIGEPHASNLRVRLILLLSPFICLAQSPTIGLIEVYGARRTPAADVREIAGVNVGERLPSSKAGVEDRLLQMELIEAASLEAACCEDGQVILYIGVQESGGPLLVFRDHPYGTPVLPEVIDRAYSHFLDEVRQAGREGSGTEDLSQGHSLLAHAGSRQAQEAFISLADQHADSLREVLRRSGDSEDRAKAAYILGYRTDKKSVVPDLSYALYDADPGVRSNAARALAAIATLAIRKPSAGIAVDPSWFIDLLQSDVWTDRNNAAVALVTMTESRNRATLDQLRKRAMPSLIEMARWKHLPHALPAYILLGRTAGIGDSELQKAWAAGERDRIIDRAVAAEKKLAPLDRR